MNGSSRKYEETSTDLSYYDSFMKLHNYKLPFSLNARRVFHATFQELFMISVLATITALVDFTYFTLLRKEGEDETVPYGFPLAIIFGIIMIKYLIETVSLKGLCSFLGITYMGSSSLFRIMVKLCLLALLAGIKKIVPWLDVRERRQQLLNPGSDFLSMCFNAWGLALATQLGHLGMIGVVRLFIDSIIYCYKLMTYTERDEMEVLEEKKEEPRRSTIGELNNNSHLNFRSPGYGMSNRAS